MSDEEIEDENIIRLLRSENETDINLGTELLITKYDAKVKATIYRSSPFLDHHLRNDIRQIALMNFLGSIKSDKFRNEGKLSAFITTIAKRKTVDFVRKEANRREVSDELTITNVVSFDRPPDVSLTKQEMAQKIHETLQRLKPECQEIIKLRYFQDLSHKKIATELSATTGAVGGKLHRCLEKLFQEFSDEDKDLSKKFGPSFDRIVKGSRT